MSVPIQLMNDLVAQDSVLYATDFLEFGKINYSGIQGFMHYVNNRVTILRQSTKTAYLPLTVHKFGSDPIIIYARQILFLRVRYIIFICLN